MIMDHEKDNLLSETRDNWRIGYAKKLLELGVSEECRGALEKDFPELKKGEDERIRKNLIELLLDTPAQDIISHHLELSKVLAYLEKLKDLNYNEEQMEDIRQYAYNKGIVDAEEKQKEQKLDCKYECALTDEQLMATDFWKEYLKESIISGNKPTKADIDFLLPIARKYFCLVMKEACTICKDWSNGYQEGLEAGSQKPAEVNVKALLTADRLASAEMTGRLKERSEIIDNPEKCGLQKPAEWSEEDKRKIVELKTFIAQCNGFNKENRKKAFDMIDAIRPQPHWKPSEEQMGALNYAYCELFKRKDVGHNILGQLQKLIDELQKLL